MRSVNRSLVLVGAIQIGVGRIFNDDVIDMGPRRVRNIFPDFIQLPGLQVIRTYLMYLHPEIQTKSIARNAPVTQIGGPLTTDAVLIPFLELATPHERLFQTSSAFSLLASPLTEEGLRRRHECICDIRQYQSNTTRKREGLNCSAEVEPPNDNEINTNGRH